jgi:hypothetical protein
MAATIITLRSTKGSPLTNTEMDTNISLLNSYSKGHLSKTITTNTTLTDVEAENYFFNISGTLTADVTITIPSILIKSWTVNNITSGGFNITVKYATGAGITIQNGTRSTFYFDGTDMRSISYSNTVRISDTGTVTNTMLVNSTISGVSLGSNLNALTIGTGLSGTSFNGSSAVTIAIDSTVVTLTGSQTLTNKTITSPVVTTSLTTGSTSFNLLNTTAATVNFAGAATILSMGATTGTSTINNDLVVSGNLTVNGITTTINTATLTVDDKNIELGSVPSATISATGTVGTITGVGPWTAVLSGMSTTTGLIVGSSLSATVGTGSLGGSGSYIVTSIDSKTQVSYSATGGTTPVAGSITTITTTGYNNTTANGAGITVKGVTDKTLNWVGTTTAWTSSENLDIASGKSYSIAGTNVLSSTTLGSGVTTSSLTSVGTIGTGVWNGTTIAVLNGGTGATTAGSARTNLGSTTVGDSLFTLTNVAAISFLRVNANNTVSTLDAASFRTAIGATTGTVTSVTGTSPVVSSGGTAPIISMAAATTSVAGYLTAADWTTFNGKQNALGFTPIQQGGGTSQSTNKLYIGWAPNQLRLQVDSTDFGATWPIDVSGFAAYATNQSGGTVDATTGAFGNKITISGANNTTTGGGQLYLNGATGNRIDFVAVGVAPPAFTTRSVGTKIVLYPAIGALSADFALGIENNTLWTSVPSTSNLFKWYGGTTLAATLSGDGNFEATANITAYSDERLKENIQVIPNALDKVKSLRGVTFTRNDMDDKEKVHTGVIAQEVLEVLPEAVYQNTDGIYSVAYGNMVGLLIESIKELTEQNKQLLQRIEVLENK